MFSWSKKKDTKRRGKSDRDSEENEFGIKLDKGPDDKQLEAELKRLAGVDSLPENDLNLNDGEEDEELELLRLIGGGKSGKHPKKAANPSEPSVGKLSQELLDVTAEIDLGEDDEVDENDPDLLGELLELTNPDEGVEEEEQESDIESEGGVSSTGESELMTTLKERLKLYKTAEAKAKENNETSRARRFSRGIKTLEDLIKKAKAGKPVSPSDIPPVIALNLKPAPPPVSENVNGDPGEITEGPENLPQATENATENEKIQEVPPQAEDIMTILIERLKLYQIAEAKAKDSGESTRARRFSRGIKTLEELIKEAKAGKQISPADIPPVIALNLKPAPPAPIWSPSEENVQDGSEESLENEMGSINLASVSDDVESKEPQEQQRNILEVLSERLKMYKTAETKAQEAGETSRVRRFSRGAKTLQELIRQATAGKPISPDSIPPEVALNLKPISLVEVSEEEKPREAATERENLIRSSDLSEKPLSFAPVDDVDVELELEEDMPTTVLEGLQRRVRLYSRFQQEAKEEGNLTLADQNGRIVGVYLNAIKTFKNGGYVDVENLPNPKGCPPIPIPFFAK